MKSRSKNMLQGFRKWMVRRSAWVKRTASVHPLGAAVVVGILIVVIVHVMYRCHSVDFLEAQISADALLEYCGILLGFVFVALSNRKKQIDEGVTKAICLEPKLTVAVIPNNDLTCEIEIRNDTPNYYYDISLDEYGRLGNLLPNGKKVAALNSSMIESMLTGITENKMSSYMASPMFSWASCFHIELSDENNRRWRFTFASESSCLDGNPFYLTRVSGWGFNPNG